MTIPEEVPEHTWKAPGSINVPIAKLPTSHHKNIQNADAFEVAEGFVTQINQAIQKADYKALSSLFTDGGYWRDHLSLSWHMRTVHGQGNIQSFLESASKNPKGGFRLKSIAVDRALTTPEIIKGAIDRDSTTPCLIVFVTIETSLGKGDGVLRLVSDGGPWKIFTIYTALRSLHGHEGTTGERRPKGVEHGGKPGRKNWVERRHEEAQMENGNEPAVLILGAGQGGLTISARLKALGVKTLMIDQNERIGDNWRKRYHQLVLHDPVWYDHMPYIQFPPQWPIYTPKDKLADFFESYAKLLELDAWMSSTILESTWDDAKRVWTVKVQRKLEDGTVVERTLHPRHLIQATGHSGKKNMPDIKGIDCFQGHLLCHSSEFPGARLDGKGKKAIVVGSCNSAHDIAQDFHEKGYDITIVQRSTTCVVSSYSVATTALGALYSEGAPPTDLSDIIQQSLPTSVLKAAEVQTAREQGENDRSILDGLAKAGFKTDNGPDDSGLFMKYLQRGGGYYIDVGASTLIAEGKIKIKQGQQIAEVLPHGLRFTDGTELEADEVVFATGYQNMRTQTRILFGDEVADRIGDVWGYNEEGEMRVMWQKSGHPGFWLNGGNLALCRYYSQFLALQIKAIEAGVTKYEED